MPINETISTRKFILRGLACRTSLVDLWGSYVFTVISFMGQAFMPRHKSLSPLRFRVRSERPVQSHHAGCSPTFQPIGFADHTIEMLAPANDCLAKYG